VDKRIRGRKGSRDRRCESRRDVWPANLREGARRAADRGKSRKGLIFQFDQGLRKTKKVIRPPEASEELNWDRTIKKMLCVGGRKGGVPQKIGGRRTSLTSF